MPDIQIGIAQTVRLLDGTEGTIVAVRQDQTNPKFTIEISGTQSTREVVTLDQIKEVIHQPPYDA